MPPRTARLPPTCTCGTRGRSERGKRLCPGRPLSPTALVISREQPGTSENHLQLSRRIDTTGQCCFFPMWSAWSTVMAHTQHPCLSPLGQACPSSPSYRQDKVCWYWDPGQILQNPSKGYYTISLRPFFSASRDRRTPDQTAATVRAPLPKPALTAHSVCPTNVLHHQGHSSGSK